MEECWLRVFENKNLRRTFVSKINEKGKWRKYEANKSNNPAVFNILMSGSKEEEENGTNM